MGDVIQFYYELPGAAIGVVVMINLFPKIGTATLSQFVKTEVIGTQRVYLYP